MRGQSQPRQYRQADDGYPQSRGAQMQMWGGRRIDASTRYADPSTNIGSVGSPSLPGQGLTTNGAGGWDAMFKPRGIGAAPGRSNGDPGGAPPAPMTSPGYQSGQAQVDSDTAFGGGAVTPSASSLPLLANGGVPKHTDMWGGGIKPITSTVGTQGSVRQITGLAPGQYGAASFVPGQNNPAQLAKRKSQFQRGA